MPRKKQFVIGSSNEEKFKSIETTLRHFSHRLGRKVVGLVPATPVVRFVVPGDDGVLLNMICPSDGKITQGCIYIESNEKRASLGFQVRGRSKIESDTLDLVTNTSLPFRFDTNIKLGDMITLWIEEQEVDGIRLSRVKSVWLAFLYEISSGLSRRDIPIEHIMELVEEDSDALSS